MIEEDFFFNDIGSFSIAVLYYLRQKKTEHDVKKVKLVKVFKKIRTIAIFMRKDVPNPGKLVWWPYD